MQYLLLDGFNLAFRAFYGIPELSRQDGFPTNAIHGWYKTINKLKENYPESKIICFFDSGGDAFREELFPEYKQNRSEMPDSLSQQLPVIERLTKMMGIPMVKVPGVEADDLLGTHAVYFASKGEKVMMVSADKDLAQIVSDNILQLLPPPTANPRLGWREIDKDGVLKKFGVPAERIIDYLALVGDSADNIPGVPGVGPKTAAKWILAYPSIEDMIANAAEVKPPRFKTILPTMAEQLSKNIQLVTLRTDLAIDENLDQAADPAGLHQLLTEMEMKTTAKQVQQEFNLS